jgi:hypothetical protein
MKTMLDEFSTFYAWKNAHATNEMAYQYLWNVTQILNARYKMLSDRLEALEGQQQKMHGSTSDVVVLPCTFCRNAIEGVVCYVDGEQACAQCARELNLGTPLDEFHVHQTELFP